VRADGELAGTTPIDEDARTAQKREETESEVDVVTLVFVQIMSVSGAGAFTPGPRPPPTAAAFARRRKWARAACVALMLCIAVVSLYSAATTSRDTRLSSSSTVLTSKRNITGLQRAPSSSIAVGSSADHRTPCDRAATERSLEQSGFWPDRAAAGLYNTCECNAVDLTQS
jgi:hypothetical protein